MDNIKIRDTKKEDILQVVDTQISGWEKYKRKNDTYWKRGL